MQATNCVAGGCGSRMGHGRFGTGPISSPVDSCSRGSPGVMAKEMPKGISLVFFFTRISRMKTDYQDKTTSLTSGIGEDS